MAGKWIKLGLAASIAINVAFVGTTLFHWNLRQQHVQEISIPPVVLDKVEFQLREEQEKDILLIIKKFKMDMLNYKQEILDKRIAIIEAMSDTEFNPEVIDKKTVELNELENQLNLIFVEALVHVNNILDSKQRLTFLLHLSRNWFFITDPPATQGEYHE